MYSNFDRAILAGTADVPRSPNRCGHSPPRHWVQTPYRYFPIEPRWLLPLSPAMPWGRAALADVLDVELLSATERRYNFEDSKILWGRVAGPYQVAHHRQLGRGAKTDRMAVPRSCCRSTTSNTLRRCSVSG